MGAAEVTCDLLVGTFAFVLSDEEHSFPADSSESCEDGAVVAEASVSVEFAEVFYHEVKIIGEQGSLGMASDLNGLPGGEAGIDAFELCDLLSLEASNLFGIVDALD